MAASPWASRRPSLPTTGDTCATRQALIPGPPGWRDTEGMDFPRSWTDPDLDQWRDTCVRFIETELQPDDAAARERGHVGHEVWQKAGALGLLCADIPEQWGGDRKSVV